MEIQAIIVFLHLIYSMTAALRIQIMRDVAPQIIVHQ